MNKVVISGFYGFHNIGDEAILLTLTKKLKEINPNVQITVLSNNPVETMQKFDVKAINRSDALKVAKVIMQCDVLLSGGGSLLQDVTSARSIHYYLSIIRMGLIFRKKVFLISHGVGPLIRASNKRRVKRVLNKVYCITVRDIKSYELLMSIGVKPEKAKVTTDPVMALDCQTLDEGKHIIDNLNLKDPSRKKLAIAIRQKDFRDDAHRDLLVQMANRLAKRYNVIFVPFYYKNDTKIFQDIHDKTDEHVYFIIDKYNSLAFLSLIQNMDILVGSRLHSLIFSLVAEVPFVGISYDPKIENFLETIQMAPICSIHDFRPDAIESEITRYEQNYETVKAQVIRSKASLIKLLEVNDEILKTLI
ncbi:polysaccharide pyruvyl transferase CsaB [Fusibacter sp. 3D3]|uniref:polysaccharide pyruvyl transferase CsaB n=1 Tax=Fusibacter sp. 3D3 TaxID=1048380 RepID=UPI00085361BA|nr:polysaccharide pyruvyl transferase CsaB [Fusibacter sp. 3D3]GAU78004.1 CsaB protein [Fusibacter sp. 3D3]